MWICPKCGREFKRKNQSHYCGEAPKTVEEYISQQDKPFQSYLLQLHQTICEAVPGTKSRIAWSMPTYGEKVIVIQFAAFKKYVSLYVGEDVIEHFQADLKTYECKKSAVYLKYDMPFPKELIVNLAQWCSNNS